MKIGAFTIMTDGDYRQDPWRESIRQMLQVFDYVVVVHGSALDAEKINKEFNSLAEKRLILKYLYWPQPEWSYEELPKHLNLGLNTLKELGCNWGVKLDIDMAIHEKDESLLRTYLSRAERGGHWLMRLEKYQFFKPNKCYEKGKIPIAVNLSKPIMYGFDFDKYTDLCQPIKYDGQEAIVNGKPTGIPAGRKINDYSIMDSPVHVWNYDYTFKTEERASELIYEFDKAHERFWGQGYSGKRGDEITKESAMHDFIMLSSGRWQKMIKDKKIEDHPKHFIESLKSLSYAQFGFGLWGKIVQ